MKLVLIRHTSVDVPKGICYGQTDVPLAASFPDEAAAVKQRLAGYRFDKVYCSPLSRCVRLAEFCGYPGAIRDERLKEIHFGAWEMRAYAEIDEKQLRAWCDDYLCAAPPGGESVMDQRRRFLQFVDEIRKEADTMTVGLFTHGGILINALSAFRGESFERLYAAVPPYGSVIETDI